MAQQHGSPQPAAGAPRAQLAVVAPLGEGLGDGVIAMPGEDILLARVALPLSSHRARQAAAGFAVEDLIAVPLDAVHVVLGPEAGPGEYLVAVVGHAAMAAAAARTDAAHPRLVPETLALPVPTAGSLAVRATGGRVLARRSDGTGYATRAEAFESFWRADGTPQIVLYGGRLPDGLPVSAAGIAPSGPSRDALAFDLMTGSYARNGGGARRALIRIAAVAALALAAHGAILAAETWALQQIANARETELRSELASRFPDLPAAVPLDVALRRAAPPSAPPEAGGFIALFARVSAALVSTGVEVALRDLSFDAAEGSLAMLVEGADLAALQRIETALGAAGLAVTSGVATTGDGAAEVRFVIGAGGS